MQLAYFIMVHHKPEQFRWLFEAIDDPRDLLLVHVDAKSRLGIKADRRGLMTAVKSICGGKPNVRIMRSRFTNWGGWSLSQVLIDAIAEALKASSDWEYFVNLSGQCYPLQPIEQIRRELRGGDGALYVEMRPMASLPPDDWHHRAQPMFETPLRALPLRGRKPPPRGFSLDFKGSQWTLLPRDFCEWLVAAPLTRAVSAYLRGLMLSDELVIQALAANGPFADRIAPHYRRDIVWPGPKVMNRDDLPRLLGSDAWFARKFDAAADPEVLETLARAIGAAPVQRLVA